MAADANQVRDFLLKMKMALASGKFSLAERDKNMAQMAEHGMLPSDVPRVLQRLSVSDYHEGPLDDDRGRPKQWWVFGPSYEGVVWYIKVCITQKGCVQCLSFHRAAHPLTYPLRPAPREGDRP